MYPKEKLDHFRRNLLERKRRIWQDVSVSLRDELGEEYQATLGSALDEPEKAFIDLMGDTDMAIIENRRDELEAIEEAIDRIDQGRYGICTECGEPISERRLEVMPYAVRCVEDQQRVEGRKETPSL
ncbi:MAG: TraR/DksA C4-type zinc finger protein [Pseudomonadota bacterium]